MSMLTPLGTGPRKQRRWPRVLAVLLGLAAVGAVAYGVWWWTQNAEDDPSPPPAASPSCRTPELPTPSSLPKPAQVTVSVANGTEQAGLALDTADALVARGFDVADIGNTDKPVRDGVGFVRYAPRQLASAITLASYVPGVELVEVKRVPDADAALWIGPDFTDVVSAEVASPDSVELPAQDPICRKNP